MINMIRVFYSCCVLFCANCIIDMQISQFSYIANHLSKDECYRLVTLLRYTAYELPADVKISKQGFKNASCIKLLIDYSEGKEQWQGENKSHEVIAHRLRQIGKSDVADWLGNVVFHHLAKDINDSLVQNPFAVNRTQSALNTKLHQDKEAVVEGEWDLIDITLWIVLASLLTSLIFSCCRILCLSCTRSKRQSTNEEMKVLLKQERCSPSD